MAPKAWLVLIAVALLVWAAVGVIRVVNYAECRGHGFSVMYCVLR